MVILTLLLSAPIINAQQKIQKDETLGMILSFTAPGLGQVYAGRFWRGVGIAAVEGICAGTAAGVAFQKEKVTFTDTDGNDHKIWVSKGHLSGGEIAAVATAAVAGLGIYIWQIFDARKSVRGHNQKQGFEMGVGLLPNGSAGVQVRMGF